MNTYIPILNMTIGGFISRAVLVLIVVVWTIPTLGLFVSSLRDPELLGSSGWWESFSTIERNEVGAHQYRGNTGRA
ncbi:MAG: hypothetical protein HC828_15740 [Blastochloris sp.]|nr:hypothetical protein [Blastochloris sp.]